VSSKPDKSNPTLSFRADSEKALGSLPFQVVTIHFASPRDSSIFWKTRGVNNNQP